MDTLVLGQSMPHSPQKRRLSQTDIVVSRFDIAPVSPHSMDSTSTKNTAPADRQASPAPSDTSSLTSMTTGATPPASINLDGTADSERPAKRRKMTVVEKEQKRIEKEAKDKLREEAKAKKEEEKQVKDEERRLKNEVKEEKRREKELKQQEKEEEKRKKQEEKEEERRKKQEEKEEERRKKQEEADKKERQQLRMGNFFFKKPTSPSTQVDATPKKTKADLDTRSDYSKTFFPFSTPKNTTCAPISRFSWDADARRHFETTIEKSLQPETMDCDIALKTSLSLAPFDYLRGEQRPSVREIVTRITDSNSGPQDTSSQTAVQAGQQALSLLRSVPLKRIYFSVDVRPPYIGTFTKIAGEQGSRLARNPFSRRRIDTDYDYDSEAEWEEPEEGEELGSDAESDAESTAETDDMDGFLDDEEAEGGAKRRFLVGDMEPVSSGLCWEDPCARQESQVSMRELKLSLLLDNLALPIDPFSVEYWMKESREVKQEVENLDDGSSTRPPLQSVLAPNGFAVPAKVTPAAKASPATPKTPKTPGKILSGEDLDRFKQEVAGQTVNKAALLGLLKQSFPKITNNVLKDTLNSVAARIGRTEAEKKWVIAATDSTEQ